MASGHPASGSIFLQLFWSELHLPAMPGRQEMRLAKDTEGIEGIETQWKGRRASKAQKCTKDTAGNNEKALMR